MFQRQFLTAYLIIISLFIFIWGITLQFLPTKTNAFNYWFNAGYSSLYLIGSLVSLRKAYLFGLKDSMGKGFLAFGLALGFYTLALWVWSYFNLLLKIDIPYPSIADLYYILFYILSLYGFWRFIEIFLITTDNKLLYQAIGVFLVVAIISIAFSILHSSQESTLIGKLLDLFYPLADSLLLAAAFVGFRMSSGKIHVGFLLIIFAFIAQAVGDIIFIYNSSNDLYWNGDISDLIFAAGGLLFSLGLVNISTSVFARSEN